MANPTPRTWYAITGAVILLAVLMAGCTGPQYSPGPVTTQATPATTSMPPSPLVTTFVTTTATPLVTTIPATTTTAATTTPAPLPPAAVTIMNFAFSPASVTVPRGTTVTWTNRDPVSHTIVNDGTAMSGAGQIFSSTAIGQGQTFAFTFTDAGTYPYHCGIHPSMHGTVIVM